MALTQEDTKALCAPFAYEDHEFTRGFVYITEQAITRRLDSVDPSWDFIIIETVRDATSASVTGRLAVCGVERDGIGTQAIEYSNTTDRSTGEKKPLLDAAGNPREAGEARKGAATDALKRAARLFGVGRYLLDAPEEAKFKAWLRELRPPVPAGIEAPRQATNGKSSGGITVEQATDLEMVAKAANVSRADLLNKVLQVERYGLYTGTIETAEKSLAEYVIAMQRVGGAK
jgi:hypothetical protein